MSAACDSEPDPCSYKGRLRCHLLDERGGLGRICLRATRQIGVDSMSLNDGLDVSCPARFCLGLVYVFDPLFTLQGPQGDLPNAQDRSVTSLHYSDVLGILSSSMT